jgi:hypothetical protein
MKGSLQTKRTISYAVGTVKFGFEISAILKRDGANRAFERKLKDVEIHR